MTLDYARAATRWFGRHPDELGASERKALARAVQRRTLTEDPNRKLEEVSTLGLLTRLIAHADRGGGQTQA